MQVRKMPLGDGDGLGDQACVAVDLAPLAGQTPGGPTGDVAVKTTPHKPRWNNMTGGEPPGVSNMMKMIKNAFLNLRGTIGRKLLVETSPARHWAPVWWKANLRGVPPSKRCVSRQRFCSAAISSKSTGSATDIVATDPVVVLFGWDKKSATTFFKLGKYNSCTLNSEMNAKWLCCLGELGVETQEMAKISGLSDLSRVEKLDLRKNGRNVWLLHGQLIILDQK
jgi:hypothetical protein